MGVTEAIGSGSSTSLAPPPAGPAAAHLQSVEDMLRHLKQNKLTDSQPLRARPQLSTLSDNVCLVGENSGRIKWIQPSGKLSDTAKLCLFCCTQLDAVC